MNHLDPSALLDQLMFTPNKVACNIFGMNGDLIAAVTAEYDRTARKLHSLHRALVALKADGPPRTRRKMSAASRRKISAAQKRRWAKVKRT